MADRLNIALMVGDIDDGFTNDICRGAMQAAEDLDMNLIILPGRYTHDSGIHGMDNIYEYQYNVLFDYADMEGIDAVVAAVGTICSVNIREDKENLLSKCGNVPVICLVSREDNYPVIRYDNKSGIREAISFLIEKRNCSRIGMISGDLHNDDAEERLEAYRETLEAYGIKYEESRVAYGNLIDNCERQVNELLDNNPDLQALISANDEMAKSIYRVCGSRGIRIGSDLYVIGYDDIEDSCRMDPPLASVRADAAELGYQAMIACRSCESMAAGQIVTLRTRFINRESAGPIENSVSEMMNAKLCRDLDERSAVDTANMAVDYFFHAPMMDREAYAYRKGLRNGFVKLVLGFFGSRKETEGCIDEFESIYGSLLANGVLEVIETDKLAYMLRVLYEIRARLYPDEEVTNRRFMDRVFAWIQKGVECQSTKLMTQREGLLEAYHRTNLIGRDILTLAGDAEQSYSYTLEKMPKINIPYSVLAVWEDPVRHKKNQNWVSPEYIYVKAVNEYGKSRRIQRTRQKRVTRKLFREFLMDTNDRFSAIVLDIFYREEQMGLLLCKLDYEELVYGEFLTYQISMAVRNIRIYQHQKEIEKQLEETLERTRSMNIVLDNASMRDELTGIYNRRGFYRAAEELMSRTADEPGCYIVAYADLDYLKIINDNYGHDDGDFAIKGITEILTESFGAEAVVGRVGGDEFVIIDYETEAGHCADMNRRIKESIRRKNTVWRKPYRVSASVGIQEFAVSDNRDLKLMIEEADDLLYEQKNRRTTSLEVLASKDNK